MFNVHNVQTGVKSILNYSAFSYLVRKVPRYEQMISKPVKLLFTVREMSKHLREVGMARKRGRGR